MVDANVRDDCISDDGGDQDEEHNDATEFEPIGYEGDGDCHDGCNGVRDDGPQLGFIGSVAELDDDSGEEETEGVEAG